MKTKKCKLHQCKLGLFSIFAVATLMMSGCTVEEPEKVTNEPAKTESTDNKKSNSTDESTEDPKAFTVGDSVKLGDVIVTFNGVKTSKGSDYNKPEKGKVFVLPSFTIENKSKDELTVSSMLSFEAYQDGYATSLSLTALMEKGNAQQLDGSVAVNKKMKGVVGYEVPKKFKELEITINLDVLSDKKITFVYTKGK